MPSAVCPAARCWDWHRPTPLPDGRSWAGAGAGAGARAGAGRWGCGAPWRAEASGRAAFGTPAVENGSAPLHGSGLAATPGKDSWKHRSLFLEAAFPPDRHDGTAPALSDSRCSCIPSRSSGSAALLPRNLGPVAWRAPFDANCLLGCVHPQEDRDDSASRAFQGRVVPRKQMWTFPPMFNLCLLSPWGSISKKMTLKGYDFLLHTKLVILGLLFLFPLFYSFSPLPSPEQKRSYISSGSVFMGDSIFFLLLTTFFS